MRELPRASVVFTIGALDAYLSELSAEVIVVQLNTRNATNEIRETISKITKECPWLPIEVATAGTAAQREAKLHDAIVEYFHSSVSNHGSKAVAASVTRMGKRASDFWAYLQSNGYPQVVNELDLWTQKRHDIIHKGEAVRVTRPQALSATELVEAIVSRLDHLFDNL